jgi:hypothetical protein
MMVKEVVDPAYYCICSLATFTCLIGKKVYLARESLRMWDMSRICYDSTSQFA